MAVVFPPPATLTPGDRVTDATTGAVWIWTGERWVGAGGGGGVTPSPIPPGTPNTGDLWYDTSVIPHELKIWNGSDWTTVGGDGASVDVGTTPPASPSAGNLWWRADIAQLFVYTGSEWVIAVNMPGGASVPIVFVLPGQPEAGAMINVPMVTALSIPANLAGSQYYNATDPTAAYTFTLLVVGGAILGTVSKPAGAGAASFSGAGGNVVPGQVLRLIAQAAVDTTLADVGITILATRT